MATWMLDVANALQTATARENHPKQNVMELQIYVLNVTQVLTALGITSLYVLHQKHALNVMRNLIVIRISNVTTPKINALNASMMTIVHNQT